MTICSVHNQPSIARWCGQAICPACMQDRAHEARALRGELINIPTVINPIFASEASRYAFMALQCWHNYRKSQEIGMLAAYHYWQFRTVKAAYAHPH